MFSKIWPVNICLAGLALFFGTKTHEIWVRGEKTVPKMQVVQKSEPSSRVSKRAVKRRVSPESSYEVVATRNLFSPERAESVPPDPDPEPEVKQLSGFGKNITLYGVIIMDDYKSALISNPLIKEPDERQNKWVKVGDMIDELEVTEIRKERILLAEKEEKYEILLYNKDKPVRNGKTKKAVNRRAKKAVKPTVVMSESKKRKSGSGVSKKKGSSQPGYEIINTPFGEVKRKKRGTSGSSAPKRSESLEEMGVPNFGRKK